jgi:transposase
MGQTDETTQDELDEQMPFTPEEWAQTPKAVQEFLLLLLARMQEMEAELADLREQVNRNSRNSSRPPSSDSPGVPPKAGKRAKSGRRRGAQKGHKGKTRKLVPIDEVKESFDVTPKACASCGNPLTGTDAEPYRHQVTEIPPTVAEVSEYRLHTLTCPGCGTETRAELPAGVPRGAFGPRLQAMVSLASGHYHLSKRKTEELMADFFQANVCLGSVSALERRTSEAIREPVEQAREHVQTQSVVHMDETGWREENQRAWLWVAATTWVTVFLIRRSRGSQIAKEMLGQAFQGILTSDRWSAYNWLRVLWRQLCWAHLLRDFQAFVDRGGESQRIGEAILAQTELMFQWWHKVHDGTMSRGTFQEQMQSVQRRVGTLLRQGTSCDHSKTAGTCRDILKREEALWTFVRVEGVEPTNNFGERQVRPGVLWRNGSFGTQSEAGSRFVERIMTVVATLRQQQRNVLDYLTEACDAVNWGRKAPSLLPGNATTAG